MAQDLFDLSSIATPGTGGSLFNTPAPFASADSRTAFQRNYVNFADPAVPDSYPAFTGSRDLMTLDTDPTGERTRQWAARVGNPAAGELVQGLSVFGRAMSRDRLMQSDAGRQLLEIAEKNRKGIRRGFWESLFDVSLADLPFVGMIAALGNSVSDAVTVSDTMKKLQNGEAVTDDELIKTRLYMAKQERDANGTWGATVGGIVRAAPGFMVEMLASGGLLAAARAGLTKAGVRGTSLAMTRATKTLAREAIEAEAEKVVTSAVGRAAGRVTAAEIAGLAGSDAGKGVVRAVTDQLFRFMKSTDAGGMYKAFSDDALMEMAKGRAQRELSNLIARRGGTAVQNGFHSFTQWLGRHASAGLLDFGTFGTEEATVLFTRQTTAGRALADALGVLTVEAPLKGSMLMIPKKAVEQAVVAPLLGQDGRVAGRSQLSLQYSALVSGNRRLMDNAEALAFGMDLLEYISENTGAGFKSALAAGGIGLERLGVRGLVRPVETAISPLGTALPTTGAEGYGIGGLMYRFVRKALGTREGFAQKVAGMETDLVVKRLGLAGAEREAIASAVRTGSTATLRPELRAAVGNDIGRFVKETVDLAFKEGERNLQYKTYARYAAAKWMQKHGIGPETAMNLFRQMGYDGVLGEMFEERYSDVVQGLLGMGDRADTVSLVPGTESPEAASFLNNVKEAVKGLYPGWEQLTAEAVGFMFPMVTRGLTMRAMSAVGGGGELAKMRATLDMLDDAMRHNTVGEMTYSDAEAAFAFAREADAAEVRSLTERLGQARAAGDAAATESLERELATRAQVAQRRAERQKVFMDSVDEAAKATADALIAVPLDTYGTLSSKELTDRAPVLTESEARQVLDSQRALGDFASQLARQLVEGQLPLEGESENMFRKLARRIVGVAGFLATGDFSLTAANAAQWTARDMGLSKKVVDALQTGFRAELTRTRDDMYAKETDRAKAEGRAPAAIPAKEVLDEAQRRFDLRARQIMTANLAVHQLRSFTDGRLREEAAQLWARKHVDTDGRPWQYTVDAEGRGVFYKLSEDGKDVDPASRKPLAELYGEHAADIDKVKRDILNATVDIMTRRLTGSDAGRNTVISAVSLDAGSDMLDIALYDAAMHMIGAQDLIYRVSLDGRTPLRSVMESRAVARVSDQVVGYIASKQAFEDVDGIAYESVAQALGLRFDGTEEGLRARNEKIFRMAKLMRLHRREGNLYFSREILEEESDEARMSSNGTSTLVAERQSDGTYRVDFGVKKDNPKERDVRVYKSEASVFGAMLRRGYARDTARTILTQAKAIESSDMFWMIRELGLARDYYDRLGPRGDAYTHPAFRRGVDGKFLPLDDFEDETGATRPGAETILRQELASAARGKLPGASIADQRMYERLFGENGYMAVGEKLLADRGIHKDTLLPYTGEFHDYAPSRYTYLMSAGRISPKSADTYVVVDPHDQADLTSGLVNAVLLHAFARNGDLLRDALAGTVSDFVKDVRVIAKDALAEARAKKDTGLASQLETFLRTCCDDVDRIVVEGGKEVKKRGIGLSSVGFVTLANAFGLFRAREDATSPMLRALATIAPRVWNAPSFLGFEGLLNVALGGNFFDTAVWSAKPGGKDYADPALTGVPQVMALASGNASALRDAVKSALPAGLGYEQFLDAVMAQLAAQSKTGEPGVTEDEKAELRAKARAAASDKAKPEEHFTFLGGLVSVLKAAIDRGITTSTSVPDFLKAVLESVANDPNTTDRQRQAAAKQLDFLRRRDAANEAEDAYVKTRNDLAEKETAQRGQLKEARDVLDAARQRSVDLDRRALAGESVAEEERQDARTKVADATAAVETAAQAVVKTQEERTGLVVPDGLHNALNLGGNTKGVAEAVDLDPNTVDEVYDEGSADDDGPLYRAGGAAADVPDVFAADAARREDGFTTDNGSVMDETEHRLNRRQANLVAGTVLRSIPADDIGEDAFAARLAEMFPHMAEAERADVVDAFRRLDMKRLTSGRGWGDVVVAGQHFGFTEDDKSDEDRSSDNFNERALAEYNSESMVDFSEVLKRVAPESKGSVMGFIDMLRGRLRVRDAGAVGQDLLSGIVNPQLAPGMKSLAQADALHKQTLARLADADVTAVVDALVKEDPQAAFLLSYMTSLPVNARTRFAGLCSGSVAATPVEVRDGRAAAYPNLPDGKVPDRLITATFDGLVGMSPRRLEKLAKALRSDMDALDVDDFDGGDDLGKLKANAAKVAEVVARHFGRNNPLYTALTSHIAHRSWTVTEYRKAQLESVTRTKGKDRNGVPATKVDALAVIIDAVEQLASRGREPTREDVESMFVAAFTMGGFRSVGLKRPMTHLDVTDPLLTFLNLFQAALPRVMMRARIDQERERAAGSVVVAPRGMAPLLSRWMYQEGEGSFAEICRATWPDVTDEQLAECRQDGTWPDDAKTPVCAKCISTSLTPREVYRACRDAYKENAVKWVPIYSGDHASFTLLQVPAEVDLREAEAGLAGAVSHLVEPGVTTEFDGHKVVWEKSKGKHRSFAWFDRKTDTIHVSAEDAKETFAKRAWEKPERSDPLPSGVINSLEDLIDFAVAHEAAHAKLPSTKVVQADGTAADVENARDIENQANAIAVERLRAARLNDVPSTDDAGRFAGVEESVRTVESGKTILSNAELTYWNKNGVGPNPRILTASEHTDPAFHVKEILDVINGKATVKNWKGEDTGLTGHDFAGLYLITKHDGLPMKELLAAKIPKLIHFSVTTLGGSEYEPGVMKYGDLLDRIGEYLKMGLDPEAVTIRVDPIVPGVTKMSDVREVIRRSTEMGIKRIRFSVMDMYANTARHLEKMGYDFAANGYVKVDSKTGVDLSGRSFHAGEGMLRGIAETMKAIADEFGVTLGTCAEPLVIPGITREGCLSPAAVSNMLGTQIADSKSKQRTLCGCFGGKTDALAWNRHCASHCVYCYAKHDNDAALRYYDKDGKLLDNVFTRTSGTATQRELDQQTPRAPERPKDYKSFARAAYKAIGMDLMFTDTKRSAISSLEAQGTGLVGVDAQGNYGEHRVHIVHSWVPGTKNDAFLGSTFMHGYGSRMVGDMSADPDSNTKKVHVIGGAGRDLFFIKSLAITQNGLRGKFREGSAPRAVFDYLEKFRGNDDLSTDTLTDDDSYKIGPGNSKSLRVVNNGGDATVMEYVFDRLLARLVEASALKPGYSQEDLAKALKAYDRMTGDELDEAVGTITVKDLARGTTADMKLSEIMPGAMVNFFDGWSGPALDLSYREDSAMAYTVANVAHKSSLPAEAGRAPRNYEVDALAMIRTLAAGGWLKTPGVARGLQELMGKWGLLSASVYAHPKFREAMIQMDENLAELARNGEFVSERGTFSGQNAVAEMTRQIMAKARRAANLPMQGIDAPLVSAGASVDGNGNLVVHTSSAMERDMLKGSELFSDDERAFYGTNRRLALCNVNVAGNGFRYGWFLADDAEAKYPEAYQQGDRSGRAGNSAERRHACAIAWAAKRVRDLTKKAGAKVAKEEDKLAALDARVKFASMFVDHHGTSISKYGARYLSLYSVEDLFIPSNGDVEDFDYSAVQCEGQDMVFNDATKKRHVFLGGTMFGLPRTPSYNGSMWLQTVRAGLPVTEEETDDDDRGWRVGADAMVSPDPYTNAILGCDHDGDKTKLYMFSVNASGGVTFSDLPGVNVPVDQFKEQRFAYLQECWRRGCLERVRLDESGNEVQVGLDEQTEDSYYRISEPLRRQVSNSFVRALFSMSRQLPVDLPVDLPGGQVATTARETPGANDARPRQKFLGGVASSETKAFPLRGKDAKKAFLRDHALPEVIKPDGSNGTLGDPELAMELASSAEDAGDARGVMVSLARSLHLAWALGLYSTAAEKPGERGSLLGPMTGIDWLRFMYHVDGLSNATFDDIKEQVCGRLGWTKGMMDTVLTELLMYPDRMPKTDEEFARILGRYGDDIRNHGMRYWMLRNSRVDDDEAHRIVCKSFVPGRRRFTKASFMSALGLETVVKEGSNGEYTVLEMTSKLNTLGTAVGRALAGMKGSLPFVDMAGRDAGRNPALGMLHYIIFNALVKSGHGDAVSDDRTLDLARTISDEEAEKVAKEVSAALAKNGVARWTERRGLLLEARSVGTCLNYLTADPGAPAAERAREQNADTYKRVAGDLQDADLGDGRVPPRIVEQMRLATDLMYDVGRDLYTVTARAVSAAQNRGRLLDETLQRLPKSSAAVGRLMAKDTVSGWDLMGLESNQQQIPLLAEFFAGAVDDILGAVDPSLNGRAVYDMLSKFADNIAANPVPRAKAMMEALGSALPKGADAFLAKFGGPGGMRDARPLIEWVQNAVALAPSLDAAQRYDALAEALRAAFTPKVLAMRAAVESMLYICSDLMTTSDAFESDEMNRAASFLRMAPDSNGFGKRTRSYGQIAAELNRVMPQFRANDRGSLEKIRAMFDRILSGEAFAKGSRRQLVGEDERRARGLEEQKRSGGRQMTPEEWDKKRAWTRAWSFTLSRRTLLEYAREYTQAPSTVTLETWADIESKLSFPDAQGKQVKMHLQHVWDALGDDKTEVTPAVLFGALLPAYTLITARQRGVPDENSLSLLALLPQRYYAALSAAEALRRRSGDTIIPLMVGSVWAPETWQPDLDLLADDSAVDWSSPDLLQNGVQNERGDVSDATRDSLRGGAGRREYRRNPRQSNTVDIFDPAFEEALGALRDSPSASVSSLPQATAAGHLGAGAYDANTAKLAMAMGALLGSWAKVEYNGGKTFTIRGDLRGTAGAGKAVSIVVDTSTAPLLDSEEDVARLANSSAYAASFVEVLGESLGLSSAEQFLRLPKDVRQALVRKYGVGGATSSKVAWSFGAKGAATLVGRISVPAGGTTLYHEYFHQMMRMFESFGLFGEDDYEALRSTFGEDPSGRHKFNEEAAAEAFRKWVEGNSDAKADSARGVFRRIYDFLKGFLAALMRGFSYSDAHGEETLFRMMVHGIAQPSSERIGEAQMAAATAGVELRTKLLRSGRLDSGTIDAWVENKERSIRDRQFRLPKAPKASRAELEARAAQQKPQVAETAGFRELEEYDDGTHLTQEELDRSNALAARIVKRIDDPGSTAETIAVSLHKIVQLREQMAAGLGLGLELGRGVARPDDGSEDFAPVPVDADKAEIDKLVSPLVDNSLFYRTANFIRQALEDGLRGSGAWTDNLEYVVRRYRANDAKSAQDEALRKASILHGLRRALAQVNPEAAASLSNADVENSLAYRAALVMYQHLESSYLNGRTAGRAPVDDPARHASRYNVSAWILSTMPSAPADTVRQARSRIEELYKASPSGASKAELKLHLDQMDALMEVVGDQTGLSQFRRGGSVSVFDDVIGTLRAGTEAHGVDEAGVLKDITPIQPVDDDGNPTTLNPRSRAHLKTFQQSDRDPAVQESLKLALTTAYQVSAMAKYYGDLDIHPAPRGDLAEAKRLARLNGIPAHMSSLEFLGEHLVGDSNMVDNPAYVDYACQSHFIAQNVDAWLRSMVRDSFGAHEGLGRMMSDEHFEYQGLVNAVTLKENWIAHMLGVSLEPGGELLQVIRQKGEYHMQNGEVVRKVGDEYVKFDNYGRRSTSVKLAEEDIRRIDMWLKMCSAHFNGQTSVVTGVDDISFYRQLSRDPADYSIEAVTAKRDRKEHLEPVEMVVWRMTRQIPSDLLPKVHGAFVRNMLEALSRADAMMDEGTHVRGRYGTEEVPAVHDAATYNSFVIGQLVRSGTVVGYNPGGAVHQGGLPRYENAALLIPCDDIDAGFQNSETYQKLVKAGRDPSWLTRDFVVGEFRGVWDDTVRFVKRHPWLTHGDGQYFHAFGTALPFWRGSGVFMYNAVRTDRQNRITPSDRMSEAEATLQRIMESADADRTLAELGDARVVDDADKLARFIGAQHRAAQFLQDIRDGLYEIGARGAIETGVVIRADATYADLAKAFYDKARQLMWSSFTGYSDAAPRPELEDVIARYEDTRLERGEVFGGSTGFKDTDMFRMHGTLPANYQIGHKVHKCIDGITNAMMSRATLANLLLTPEGSTGAPVYYADPSEIAAEASGLPDEFWGNLAEWWQAHNPDIGRVYDPARSGVQNAKEVYKAVREKHQVEGKKAKFAVGSLGYTELPGDDSALVSVDRWMVLDGNGEDFMNATAGGEAMGYLKHFLDAGKVLGLGGAGVRAAIQRALSYSKSLSVSFSFFFPMATRWESPMGAVGAMSTIGSNWKWVGDWMKEHPDAANRIRGMFGGKAWITHDFIGMKDIVRMMDSNDPFLAELYSWAAALGITVSTSVTNPMEPDKTVLLKDIRRMKDAVRRSMGADAAGKFARTMDALLVRQGDKAFNYVLNATKLAVVAQMCMKLRHQAKSQGKAFDPVRDLRKYSRYINAEIGGIDPMQFAWAHPKARQLMNMALFSWQWTVGAWQAGGGSVLTDMLTGSRTMTRQERAYFAGRWMRMFLGVMVGVPALFQVVTRLLAKAIRGVAGLPDDDDDDKWGTWQNEDKARWTAFDLTPLLRAIAEADETKLGGILRRYKEGGGLGTAVAGSLAGGVLGGLNGGNWLTGLIGGAVGAGTGALVPGLVPLYTGGDAANQTTRQRRYYMHFGKQGWEFFRWFDDAKGQFFSKLSMPTQRIMEGIMGRSLGFLERSLPWEEQGQFERWLSPTTDSALFNIAEAFLPFSVGGINRNGDAGFLPIFGPVQMGASQTAVQKRLVAALERWATDDRRGYVFGRKARGGKHAGKPYAQVADILRDAERNGLDPYDMLDKACGQVMRGYYGRLFRELPERPDDEVDSKEVAAIVRALHRLGGRKANAVQSMKDRYKRTGREWGTLPHETRSQVRTILGDAFTNPFDY